MIVSPVDVFRDPPFWPRRRSLSLSRSLSLQLPRCSHFAAIPSTTSFLSEREGADMVAW